MTSSMTISTGKFLFEDVPKRNGRKKIFVVGIVIMLLPILLPSHPTVGSGTRAESDGGVKPMVFYLHNDTKANYIFDYSTTHIMNTTLGDRLETRGDIQKVRMNWYLSPHLAGPMRVDGNVTLVIYANTTGVSANANLNLKIYEITYKSGNYTNETLVATGGPASYTLTSSTDSYSVTAIDVHHTFQKNSSIRVYLEIQGGASSYFTAWYGDATYDARVVFETTDYIRVADMYTLNGNDERTGGFDPNALDKTIKIRANVTDPFGGYDIRWVNTTVIAPNGTLVLDNATMTKIEGNPISFNNIYETTISYENLPVGTYTIIVYAMDNNGYYYYTHMGKYTYGPYGAKGVGYFTIGSPHTIDVVVVDSVGIPLPETLVTFLDGGEAVASGETNSDGAVSLMVYTGTYTIRATWRGNTITGDSTTMVINGDENNTVTGDHLTVTSDMDVKIYANVGDLALHVSDADNNDLENAAVYLLYPNGTAVLTPLKTDQNGMINLGHVAGGEYVITVMWKGVTVNTTSIKVEFTKGSPTPTYTIKAKVYNIQITALDSKGVPVPLVTITAVNADTGNVEDFGATDANGAVRFRLPIGDKEITAYWHDVKVYTGTYRADSSGSFQINCKIYYLEIVARGKDGNPISGVDVTLEKNSEILLYSPTDDNGKVVFRVAPGEYTIRGHLSTTDKMKEINEEQTKNVNVTADTSQTLTFATYPPNPITTPLVIFSLIIILLLVLYIATVIRLKR